MHHGAKTASRAGAPKKLFAGIAALGLAAGAYGVYATTLVVEGSAGSAFQAGTDTTLAVTAACDTDGINVTENWSEPELNSSTGYSATTRLSWTITNIAAGCSGHELTLAVKSVYGNGGGENANQFVVITPTVEVGSTTETVNVPEGYNANRTSVTDSTGYSVKIVKPAT